jgi:hypothetical protein
MGHRYGVTPETYDLFGYGSEMTGPFVGTSTLTGTLCLSGTMATGHNPCLFSVYLMAADMNGDVHTITIINGYDPISSGSSEIVTSNCIAFYSGLTKSYSYKVSSSNAFPIGRLYLSYDYSYAYSTPTGSETVSLSGTRIALKMTYNHQ